MRRWSMAFRCPTCGSSKTIVLVHSLRLLCGSCMHQWTPELADGSLADAAERASAISRLLDEMDHAG